MLFRSPGKYAKAAFSGFRAADQPVGLALSEAERKELVALGRQRSSPRGIVLRINIVLGAAEGLANRVVARKLSTSVPTVLLWRRRFEAEGIAGLLEDRPRSGRP